MKNLLLSTIVLLGVSNSSFAAPNSAAAQIICRSSAGALTIRAKCKKTEVRLSMAEIAAAAYGVLPSGTTVRGAIGGRVDTTDSDQKSGVSLLSFVSPLPPGVIASGVSGVYIADLNSFVPTFCTSVQTCFSSELISNSSKCTGTSSSPTAPAGVVCLYRAEGSVSVPFSSINARTVAGAGGGIDLSFTLGTPSTSDRSAGLSFVWAYTAP